MPVVLHTPVMATTGRRLAVLAAVLMVAAAGDLPFPSWLGDRAAMPLAARLAEQAAEVDGAILGLDKARSIAGPGKHGQIVDDGRCPSRRRTSTQ